MLIPFQWCPPCCWQQGHFLLLVGFCFLSLLVGFCFAFLLLVGLCFSLLLLAAPFFLWGFDHSPTTPMEHTHPLIPTESKFSPRCRLISTHTCHTTCLHLLSEKQHRIESKKTNSFTKGHSQDAQDDLKLAAVYQAVPRAHTTAAQSGVTEPSCMTSSCGFGRFKESENKAVGVVLGCWRLGRLCKFTNLTIRSRNC